VIQAALLGIVQGLTEFLPVSSTAHLILARAFFGFDGDQFGLSFDVACHIGTLLAVVVYFRADIARMISALPLALRIPDRGLRNPESKASESTVHDSRSAIDDDARMIWLLIVGTIPAVIAGLLFKKPIEEYLRTVPVAAVALAAGALCFFAAERIGSHERPERSLTLMEAFWIGCAQALALIPGVSRSGATIVAALLIGLRRADAARFIFLLSIPAILGAAASEAPKLLKAGLGGEAALFGIGIVSSAIVGYIAVKFFIQYLGKHSLAAFAWYRLALAGVAAIWIWRG